MKPKFTLLILLTCLTFNSNAQWAVQNSGTNENLVEIFFPAADTGYVVGSNGTVLKTINGGNAWNTLALNTTLNFNDVYFLNTNEGWIIGDSGLMCKTTDGGNSWSKTYCDSATESRLNSVYFIDSNNGFVAGSRDFVDGLILKTTDGGNTWINCNVQPYSVFDVSFSRIGFVTPDTGYAISRGLIYKSTDAGNNWFITDTATTVTGALFCVLEDFHFFSADTGFVVGWYGPLFASTVNGGVHWDTNSTIGQLYTIDFPSRNIGYVAGWGYISKSTDGGNTWADITNGSLLFSSIYSLDFTDDNTGYACGYPGVIIKTTTGGTTGINDLNSANSISVFPNPATGDFQVQFTSQKNTNAKIEILNLLGERVFEKELNVISGENKVSISQLNITGGIYILKMSTDEQYLPQKLIVEKN